MAFPQGCGDHHFLFLKKLARGEAVNPLFREDELVLIRAGWLRRNDEGRLEVTDEVGAYFVAARRPPDEGGCRRPGGSSLPAPRSTKPARRLRSYA